MLISTASMHSTPWRYAGASGSRDAVAVVGQDDELEPGARRRRGDVIDGARPIRTASVDVDRSADRRGTCADAGRMRAAGGIMV